MELVATLLTDLPLDERHFHGLLRDLAGSGQAGGIEPDGLEARHCFGDAQQESWSSDIRVQVKAADCVSATALAKLRSVGFRAQNALEFFSPSDTESRQQTWGLVHLYATELQGWVLTHDLDFEQTAVSCGCDDGLLSVPAVSGSKSAAVLISATTMKQLVP